ncbi:14819_t:CDS:2, partial [Dentiscutata erythropus]
KSVVQTKKASGLTFSHLFKDVLKILQIDYTSFKISENEAEASPKKHRRKSYMFPKWLLDLKSLAIKISKFKINKLPSWAIYKDTIHISSNASDSSSSANLGVLPN